MGGCLAGGTSKPLPLIWIPGYELLEYFEIGPFPVPPGCRDKLCLQDPAEGMLEIRAKVNFAFLLLVLKFL